MLETESRQVRRARERREASPPKLRTTHPLGNRLTRQSKRLKPKGRGHVRVISMRRAVAIRLTSLIFLMAAKRADLRRATAAA